MNRLFELLAKKKSKSLSPEEQIELSEILLDKDARHFSNIIDNMFNVPSGIQGVNENEINSAVKNLINKIEGPNLKPKLLRPLIIKWIAAASLILLVALLGIFYARFNENSSRKTSRSVVQTKKGSKSMTTLPDGTKVWINADTKITYDKIFGEKTREIELEGEAYFEVVKDQDRPFIVHTNEMEVRVIGTAFNVRSYPNEAKGQTTLIRGMVEVQLKNESSTKIVLKPNEKVIVKQSIKADSLVSDDKLPQLAIVPVRYKVADSVLTDVQWVNNRLAFEDQNLLEIIPVLERWYNIDIELDKRAISRRNIDAVFENDNLEDVIKTLSLTLDFHYRISGNKIYIY